MTNYDVLARLMAQKPAHISQRHNVQQSYAGIAGENAPITSYKREIHPNALKGASGTKSDGKQKHRKRLHSIGQQYSTYQQVGTSTAYVDETTGNFYQGPEYEVMVKTRYSNVWRDRNGKTFEIERKTSYQHDLKEIHSGVGTKGRNTVVKRIGGKSDE